MNKSGPMLARLAQQRQLQGFAGVPLIQPKQEVPCVQFDGRYFPAQQPPHILSFLEWAYRARRGDESATAILNAWGVGLTDAHGEPYWPIPPIVGLDLATEEPIRVADLSEETKRLFDEAIPAPADAEKPDVQTMVGGGQSPDRPGEGQAAVDGAQSNP